MAISYDDRAYWKSRGRNDALADKGPLFRKTRSGFRAAGEPPTEWTEEEEAERAAAYLDGYESVSS